MPLPYRTYKRRGIHSLAERVLPAQEGLCSVELFSSTEEFQGVGVIIYFSDILCYDGVMRT